MRIIFDILPHALFGRVSNFIRQYDFKQMYGNMGLELGIHRKIKNSSLTSVYVSVLNPLFILLTDLSWFFKLPPNQLKTHQREVSDDLFYFLVNSKLDSHISIHLLKIVLSTEIWRSTEQYKRQSTVQSLGYLWCHHILLSILMLSMIIDDLTNCQ